MTKPSILLIGLGDLGGVVLELLAREPWVGRIVACSRDAARGEARCNLARMGAMAQGGAPDLRFAPLDLRDAGAVADLVRRESPDLIFSSAALQTWWYADLLPGAARRRLAGAGFGSWLPIHLALMLRLMQALRDADYRGVTLTAPLPDVINCVLGRVGLAPTCGVGNLDEIVPKVRLLAARSLAVPVDRVRVTLVAHHALEPLAFRASTPATRSTAAASATSHAVAARATASTWEEVPPFFLRVEADGRDVTEEVRARDLLLSPYPLPGGPAWSFLTAGSAVRLMRAVLAADETFLHAPAPHGLPGGYPVVAGGGDVRPAAVPGLALDQMIDINERSHRFDGIDRIEADGTVVFTERAAGAMRDSLRYDCERMRPDEAEGRAAELMTRFREYAKKHGVTLPERR